MPMSPSDTRRRLQHNNTANPTLHPALRPQGETVSESPFRSTGAGMGREFRALDEHSFIQNTDSRLDDFIAQGREVLDNLVDQRNVLKGTQRRLLDTANSLGLSRDVIGWIEKRRYSFSFFDVKSLSQAVLLQHTRHVHFLCWCRLHLLLFLPDMALLWITLVCCLSIPNFTHTYAISWGIFFARKYYVLTIPESSFSIFRINRLYHR